MELAVSSIGGFVFPYSTAVMGVGNCSRREEIGASEALKEGIQ